MKNAHEVKAMKSRRYNQDGFTLIEIMVVILILGLLATIVVQSLRGAADKAKRTKAQADIAEIKTALDRYYLDNGYYGCRKILGVLPTSSRATEILTC